MDKIDKCTLPTLGFLYQFVKQVIMECLKELRVQGKILFPDETKLGYSTEEAARCLSLSAATIKRERRSGVLSFRRIRGRILFDRKELERYYYSHEEIR